MSFSTQKIGFDVILEVSNKVFSHNDFQNLTTSKTSSVVTSIATKGDPIAEKMCYVAAYHWLQSFA